MSDTNTPKIIARLDAESAIHHLIASYVHFLDDGKFAEIAELLQYAEFDIVGNVASGQANIEALLHSNVQLHADGTPRTWHTLANTLIDVDPTGEKASSSSYYTVHQQLDGFPLQPIVTGKYLDRFEHQNGEWRFVHRALTVHSIGDLQHHVKSAEAA